MEKATEVCVSRMRDAQLPEAVIANFIRLHGEVQSGASGIMEESAIEPVSFLPTYDDIVSNPRYLAAGKKNLSRAAVVMLNGGLGTSMGLQRAKSLLEVKNGLSFNDINAMQIASYAEEFGVHIPFLNMTSFSTNEDVVEALRPYAAQPGAVFETFQQHKHPKIDAETFLPAGEAGHDLSWNPPGHGDMFAALASTGMLDRLLERGIQYLFVSNADNLGATLDLSILGYLASENLPFMMEVTERTVADKKGGHLARSRETGRLVLRETAQAPQENGEPSAAFQDIRHHRFFNTNNLWLDLRKVAAVMDTNSGYMPLPLIRNKKTLDPRDSKSAAVYQIETAMGAAIELFDGAQAVNVPRSRFAPVKTTSDLLVVRSDAYKILANGAIALDERRSHAIPPVVKLDDAYKLTDDFDARFPVVPSLLEAERVEIKGDVTFNSPLTIVGNVIIEADAKQVFPDTVQKLQNETFVM